jgi:hypothetical protein
VRSVVREVENAVVARLRRARKDAMATMREEDKASVGRMLSRALALA